jgi:hypothetical protein
VFHGVPAWVVRCTATANGAVMWDHNLTYWCPIWHVPMHLHKKKIHSHLLFSFFSCFHIALSLYSIKFQFDLSQYFRCPIHPYKK